MKSATFCSVRVWRRRCRLRGRVVQGQMGTAQAGQHGQGQQRCDQGTRLQQPSTGTPHQQANPRRRTSPSGQRDSGAGGQSAPLKARDFGILRATRCRWHRAWVTPWPARRHPLPGARACPVSVSGPRTDYVLSGGKKDELRTMVNSKVEMTGKIDDASAGTSNNGASSSAGTTGSAMSTGSRAPETRRAVAHLEDRFDPQDRR